MALDPRQHRRHTPQPERADQRREPQGGVEVVGHCKDVVGRPLLYSTTPEFLETFGLKDLASLPTLEELGASAAALEEAARAVRAPIAEPSSAETPEEGVLAAPGVEPKAGN